MTDIRTVIMEAILTFAVRQRLLVVMVTLGIAALGAWNFTRLPIDAVPDITNVQVQINTTAPGYSPLEVEQRITFPIETAMGGLPRLDYTRSLSRYGLSQVTVVFNEGTDIYFARQLVNERIQQVKDQLPSGMETARVRSPRGSARFICSPSRPSPEPIRPMASPLPPLI